MASALNTTAINIANLFTPMNHDAPRFRVGPEALHGNPSVISQKIYNMPAGALQGSLYMPDVDGYEVLDKEAGIIKWGPYRSLPRGWHRLPIKAMEKALGTKALPETIFCNIYLNLHEGDKGVQLYKLLAGLTAIGKPRIDIETSNQTLGYNVHISWQTDNVELKESVYAKLVNTDGQYKLSGYTHQPFLSTYLLREEDQNCVEGHNLLREGLLTLLSPFVAKDAMVQLQLSEDSRFIKTIVSPEIDVPDIIEDLKLRKDGCYLGTIED